MHESPWDDVPAGVSLVDLNRAGTPLAEIVTEPDLRSPEEAYDFLVRLRRLVRWVDASDGNMEEGSLRCDANVSLRAGRDDALGTKVEIKNLNSIAHVKKALEHEIVRQAETLRPRRDGRPGDAPLRPGKRRHAPDAVEGRGDGLPLLPRPRPRRARRRRGVARGGRRVAPRAAGSPRGAVSSPRSASPRPTPRRSAPRALSPTPSRRPSRRTRRTRRGSRTGSSATSSRG